MSPASSQLIDDSAELADGGDLPGSASVTDVRSTVSASWIGARNLEVVSENSNRVGTFKFECGIENRVDQRLTTAKQKEFEADFCRQLARLDKWAAEQHWAPYIRPELQGVELQVVVSDAFKISKSLVPAWNGHRGRMEFPAWRVIARKAAIAHELAHVFFPNGNRFLAEGLAIHIQDRIGENPAFPNFGRPLHALVREGLREMVPELAPGDPESLDKIHLAELDEIATPSPLTLKVGQDFYGEGPRGQVRIYPIAGSFVEFLIDTRGVEKFRSLYERTPLAPLVQDAGSPQRWRDIYGASLAALEAEWKSLIVGGEPMSQSPQRNFNREHDHA